MKAKPDHISQQEWDDADIPELGDDFFNKAVHSSATTAQDIADDVMRQYRGKQKAATKKVISIRFSTDVLEHFRGTGKGWQTRMDAVLKAYVKEQKHG